MRPHPIAQRRRSCPDRADRHWPRSSPPRSSLPRRGCRPGYPPFQRGAEDGAERAAARRAAGDPHNARQSTHGGVAIARSKGEPLHHRPHQVPAAMARSAGRRIARRRSASSHERTALAGFGDEKDETAPHPVSPAALPRQVRGIEDRPRPWPTPSAASMSSARSSSQSMFSVAAMLDCIWAAVAGHRECHGVAGRLGIQRHRVRVRNKSAYAIPVEPMIVQPTAGSGSQSPAPSAVHDHVDIAETNRHTFGQACLRRRAAAERMRRPARRQQPRETV